MVDWNVAHLRTMEREIMQTCSQEELAYEGKCGALFSFEELASLYKAKDRVKVGHR